MNREIVIFVETRDLEGRLVSQKEIGRLSGVFPRTILDALLGNEPARVYQLRPVPSERPAPDTNGDPMTESQRRYLFRLLSQQGIEGEAAREHLQKELDVRDLTQASKSDASALIDQLLGKEVGRAH